MKHKLVCILICVATQSAFAQGKNLTGVFSADSHWSEVYSESYYRKDLNAGMTQSRLRHLWSLKHFKSMLFAGVTLDRMLGSQEPLLIENAVSPNVGILSQPFSFLSFWLEYRYRFKEKMGDLPSENGGDPRAGLSIGHNHLSHDRFWGWDLYGEVVSVPRLSDSIVTSGYARLFAGSPFFEPHRFDFYSEMNEYTNSDQASLGPSRHQFRLGGRWKSRWERWSISLFAYKPWVTQSNPGASKSDDFESLLVIGGVF